mgnify:CR=1 FL=1
MTCWGRANRLARSSAAGKLRLFALALALGAGLLSPGHVRAETGQWSQPVRITGELPAGWFPDVAADDLGNVHVVWNSTLPGRSDPVLSPAWGRQDGEAQARGDVSSALFYTRRDAEGWTKPNDVGLAWRGVALRSSIAVGDQGRLHLIRLGLGKLEPESLGQEDLWYSSADGSRAESVASWRQPRRVTRATQGYYSDIAVDSRGVIHAIWTESSRGTWGLYYSQSTDGGATWSDRVALEGDEFVHWYRAQLKVDARDRLHVVWELVDVRYDGDALVPSPQTKAAAYAQSKDGGLTWSKTRFPPDCLPPYFFCGVPGPGPQQPAVGVDGRGQVLLVFRETDGNGISYHLSADGARWSPPLPLPGVRAGVNRPFDVYDMVTDSAGHVHLAAVGYADGSEAMSLLHVEWDGEGWRQPVVIAESPPYPEYPRLAVSRGNRLHAVWFGGDRPSVDRSPVGIWYSTTQTAAPSPATRLGVVPAASRDPTTAESTSRSAVLSPTPVPVSALGEASAQDLRATALPRQPEASPEWLSGVREHPAYPLLVAVAPVLALLATALLVRS